MFTLGKKPPKKTPRVFRKCPAEPAQDVPKTRYFFHNPGGLSASYFILLDTERGGTPFPGRRR